MSIEKQLLKALKSKYVIDKKKRRNTKNRENQLKLKTRGKLCGNIYGD